MRFSIFGFRRFFIKINHNLIRMKLMNMEKKALPGKKPLNQMEMKEVFETHKNTLYGFVLSRVKNSHDAEDLFSRSFLKFSRYTQTHPVNRETIKNLLYKITVNTINDFFRRKKIIRFISLDNFIHAEKNETYYEVFQDTRSVDEIQNIDRKHLLKQINIHVSDLPEKQREAFHLRFIQEFSFAEIASIQGTSVSTVLSRVRYAVDKLKNILKQEGALES